MTLTAARPRAVTIGAGIGGLSAGASLYAAGWHVTVCELAASFEPVAAGLALAPNGLRALDAVGVGDLVHTHAAHQEVGIRRPGGRWLLRGATGHRVAGRFGDPIIVLPRARLIDALLTRVPAGVLALSTEVTSVEAGGRVVTTAGEINAAWAIAQAQQRTASPVPAGLGPAEG